MYPNIALIGKAQAGKDSAAAHLVAQHGYRREAFADRLKAAALEVDPVVHVDHRWDEEYRLQEVVGVRGWERAKEEVPEVRRFLQHLGHSMRQLAPYIWIHPVANAICVNGAAHVPTVVTDVRYWNEVHALREAGFTFVRIVRPGTGDDSHVSETELDGFAADVTINNSGTLAELYAQIEGVIA
ncbi:deoxynucleotide monophosphate kinase family protein [Streptomyces lycii]|uniref:DNMP kinase n=1 Tax=Streptomyces lycii TaxID=2654337 RepID=A0ABQ7FJ37_9ACTN|nr:hypothetical protein [Streptomyces lycii]KAF4408647.1 hypothetical protein GCU69_13185 [Streptomyces lycii]